MKKNNLIQPREKIPRKVKCGTLGIEELRMIKEVLQKESAFNKKVQRRGLWNKNDVVNKLMLCTERSSLCGKSDETDMTKIEKVKKENITVEDNIIDEESRNSGETDITKIEKFNKENITVSGKSDEKDMTKIEKLKKENVPVEDNVIDKESRNNQLKISGLSHFMELEERKDLLITNVDDDPLCINGPEAYDAVGWTPVKQEVPDDVEVSCVTITEIPLKSIEECKTDSVADVAVPSRTTPVPNNDDSNNEDYGNIENSAKDDIKNDLDDSEHSWWNHDDYEEESDSGVNGDDSLEEILQPKQKTRPHRCEICDKILSSKSSLRIHKKKKHQINMKFNCELCPFTFDLQRDLIKHRNEVHRDNDGRFTCKDCGKYFSDYRVFLIHMKTHFEEEDVFTGEDDKEKDCFKCKDCDKVFNREERLSLHKVMTHNTDTGISEKLKQHEKNFVCHTCGKRFAFGCLLRDHINLHTGTKPYLCQSCGRSFAQKASLKQHARTHNPVRPFLCPVCNQGFFGKGDLKKHMRKHTGERPYVCEMCGDGFSQSSHLGVHRRSHTGERPFKCDVCSRGFTKKGDVVRHRRIHTGELPYLCQVCGKAFRQSTQCSNHIKNHHPDAIVSVTENLVVSQWPL